MRRILLVDDESFIRRGIRTMIERAQLDVTGVSECWNGQEALEKLSREKYDIVLLDIRMPGMDGIAFLKEAQRLQHKPKFIILSGYNDFQYAVEGIRYGAKAYLLKPIQRDEIIDALKKVMEELRKEEQIESQNRKADLVIDRLKASELNSLLQGGSLPEQQMEAIFDRVEADILTGRHSVALVKRLNGNNGSQNEAGYLKALIDKYREDFGAALLVSVLEDGTVAVVLGPGIDIGAIVQYIRKTLGGEYVTGVSNAGTGTGSIGELFLQAGEALKYKLLAKSGEIIHFDEISSLEKNYRIPVEAIKKIAEMIGTNRVYDIDGLLTEIFDAGTLDRYCITYVEELVENINRYVISYFIEHMPQKANDMKNQLDHLKNIYNFRDIKEYYHTLRNCIIEMNSFYLTLKEICRKNNKIETVLDFINRNYHKDINMTMAANLVSVNYTNFSIMFSEETGVSFVDYLRQVRIEKAKELIRDTDYKINEISRMVGFKNPKHFTRSFRSVTGISPVEYRDKCIKG